MRPEDWIAYLVGAGILSPGALTMDPQDAVDQHNEANALVRGDEGYLVGPRESGPVFDPPPDWSIYDRS